MLARTQITCLPSAVLSSSLKAKMAERRPLCSRNGCNIPASRSLRKKGSAVCLPMPVRCALQAGLLSGDGCLGRYHAFTIHGPKKRVIHAACFADRVAHHALFRVCGPWFERWAIADSYACRKGKGRLRAVRRAQLFARRHAWFLKMDIAKYFDSIDHGVLLNRLARKFKDPYLMRQFRRILAGYQRQPGVGLPIGSLASQYFANFYLDALDRLVKEGMAHGAYVRYMDDFVLWADSSSVLKARLREIESFLGEKLALRLKSTPYINRTRCGMDFLGNRVFPARIALNRASRRRFEGKWRALERMFQLGQITQLERQTRVNALLAFVREADSLVLRRNLFGGTAIGHEPREARRQLEQQRQELPIGEPQQERPGQPERQPGLSPGPSSTRIGDPG